MYDSLDGSHSVIATKRSAWLVISSVVERSLHSLRSVEMTREERFLDKLEMTRGARNDKGGIEMTKGGFEMTKGGLRGQYEEGRWFFSIL